MSARRQVALLADARTLLDGDVIGRRNDQVCREELAAAREVREGDGVETHVRVDELCRQRRTLRRDDAPGDRHAFG